MLITQIFMPYDIKCNGENEENYIINYHYIVISSLSLSIGEKRICGNFCAQDGALLYVAHLRQ